MPIKIPLQFNQGKLDRIDDERESIKEFLRLLVSSHQGSFLADKDFGFSFINHRFENISEKSDFFCCTDQTSADASKRIRGNSKNFEDGSFANDLKESIEKYEPRLKNISVDVIPETESKHVNITIKGIYKEEQITHSIQLFTW